jgi:hypothetical protein
MISTGPDTKDNTGLGSLAIYILKPLCRLRGTYTGYQQRIGMSR